MGMQGLAFLLDSVQDMLRCRPDIANVSMLENSLDRCITAATHCSTKANTRAEIANLAKSALISASGSMTGVHIKRSLRQPFQRIKFEGFRVSLCLIPPSYAEHMCWKSLQYGHGRTCSIGRCG